MSTRLRILLEINGSKYRGGEVKRVLAAYLQESDLPTRYWPSLNTVQGLQEAIKALPKSLPKCKSRLLAVREPRGISRRRSVFWQEFWKKKQKRASGESYAQYVARERQARTIQAAQQRQRQQEAEIALRGNQWSPPAR